MALYDLIGRSYAATRRPDRRIAAAIHAALGDAASVINIGAGAGSYEPAQTIAAIEPSATMIAQRPAGAAPVLQAVAEQLPLRDNCADAAMALLTTHHWTDVAAGVAELRRVARHRLVFLTWRPEVLGRYWLGRYLSSGAWEDSVMTAEVTALAHELPGAEVRPLLIPHDCTDGFGAAYWRRPAAYLDPAVRAGMSFFAKASDRDLAAGLDRLAADLADGQWQREHADLLELDSFDAGYCLIIAPA
jgi:SAM-dependent methyltransferase